MNKTYQNKVVDHSVVKIFSTQVGITSCGLDFKDSIFNSKDGDIEGTTTQIKNKDIALLAALLVETISNGGSCGLIDDTQYIESSNST